MVIVISVRGAQTWMFAAEQHNAGSGYTSRAWRNSPTLAWVDRLPADVVIYSNCPELIAFHNRRVARSLPFRISPTSLLPNVEIARDIRDLQNAMRGGAVVVYFTGSPRSYLISAANVERVCSTAVVTRFPDGAVYALPRRIMTSGCSHKPWAEVRSRLFAGLTGWPSFPGRVYVLIDRPAIRRR